jgi:hypothetical protein
LTFIGIGPASLPVDTKRTTNEAGSTPASFLIG